MTPEEITAMAEEAGFPFNKYGLLQGDDDGEIDADAAFARFAALVAAKEREACAKVAEDEDHEVSVRGYYAQLGDARAAMRNIAAAIRARGQKEGA